jgi:ATP-dependent helicase HepA
MRDFTVCQNLKKENFDLINKLADKLIQYKEDEKTDLMPPSLRKEVADVIEQEASRSIDETLSLLLDQHGTGRMLFRNTRSAISGFPKRVLHHYPLDKPSVYEGLDYDDALFDFYPETRVVEKTWINEDPRLPWLIETIRRLRPNKVLVITALKSTALALKNYLRLNTNIQTATFHEGLSIIERDRAAAYFADSEAGAECLICSEIGSEGRNFQFAHELILFDLPLSPDLLEQRIGRLDRIGQTHDINIHVPVIKNTPLESLFYWYHEGLQLFQKSCSFGFSIYEKFEQPLLQLLISNVPDKIALKALIEKTREHADRMQEKATLGRDSLLELSSCNNKRAAEIIDAIEVEEDPDTLKDYMGKVFNTYGLSHEFHSEHTEILKPSDHMKTDYFPGLKEDGNTITYSREKALVREDIEFLSVEHPMVREAMEMILNEDGGQAILSSMSLKTLPPGTLLLEAFYTTHVIAPLALDLERFLSIRPIRILTSVDGNNIDAVISHEKLSTLCQKIKRRKIYPIISQIRPDIESMAKFAESHAENLLPAIKKEALNKLKNELGFELERLIALQKVNPTIRQEELDFIETQIKITEKAISDAALKLIGVRVVINQ